MIKLIVPSMATYGDATLMLLTKTVNEIIKADMDNKSLINNLRNDITDIQKELEYLKKAVRNYG